MKTRDLFPLGVAEGEAFCDRSVETKWLLNNIDSGKHSLIISPRRYGKTTLAYRALSISKLPYIEIDFVMATSEKKVEEFIARGVSDLINKSLGPIDKLFNSIKKYSSKTIPKIAINAEGLSLELAFPSDSSSAINIMESLLLLENLLTEKKKRAVILFDEFQTVGTIAKGSGIEGAIRHVAQKTKYLSIIFSGSNCNLLKSIFEDENRPLYKLCKQLFLDRVPYPEYEKHLTKAALAQWESALSEPVIKHIIDLTEAHPYYVNKLCDIVWSENQKLPQITDIDRAWQTLIIEEKSDILRELSLLSPGQKKVLAAIANGSATNLTGKSVSMKIDMSPSSTATALDGLLDKDVIEQKEGLYKIINPVIKAFVKIRVY